MAQFNLILNSDADFDEVVDTIADAFRVGIAVEKALRDGFQFQDLLVAFQQEPAVREIINDIPVFLDQFGKLTPVTAVAALSEARDLVESQNGGSLGKVAGKIFDFLDEIAQTYAFIADTAQSGVVRYNAWRNLLATQSQA